MELKEALKLREFPNPQTEAALNVILTANYQIEIARKLLKPYDISGEQFNVLRILRGNHPDAYALKEIQNRMLNHWSNASRLVEKLRKKGYVTRRPMASNRRKVEIKITDEGLEFLKELDKLPIGGSLYDNALSSAEAEKLTELLEQFRKNLDTTVTDGN